MASYLKYEYNLFIKNATTENVLFMYGDLTNTNITIPDRGCSFSIFVEGLYRSASFTLTRQQLDETIKKVQADKAAYIQKENPWQYQSYWYIYRDNMYEFGVLINENQALQIIKTTEEKEKQVDDSQKELIESYLISMSQAQDAIISADSNFNDECMRTLFFAETILKIDPNNVIALITKAKMILLISTVDDNDYTEAVAYLREAENLEPLHPIVTNAKWELLNEHVVKLATKGNLEEEKAKKIPGFFDVRKKSFPFYKKAMTFYLMGLKCDPDNVMLLGCVANLFQRTSWIKWGPNIEQKAAQFKKQEQKKS